MTNTPPQISTAQRTAQYILIAALVLLGAWMLRRFLPALTWAVTLGIATWPAYERWFSRFDRRRSQLWPALTFTILVGVVLIVPLAYAVVIIAREAVALVHQPPGAGPMTMPGWLPHVPVIGAWLQDQWNTVVDGGVNDLQWMESAKHKGFEWTRLIGLQIMHRLITLGFTLLTLFFVYLHGLRLESEMHGLFERTFGAGIRPLMDRAVAAIRATVDGIVLVAVGEGALMAAAYAMAGVGHPVLLGAITGVFAMIPFAAPLAFGSVALVLALQGTMGAAIGILIFGALLLFFVDHFLRPVIIGGAARLPFLWVLLGILGGVESFGLVGLFVGPALMAALCSLWRDWTARTHVPQSQ